MVFARVSSSVCGPIMSRRVCLASVHLAGFRKRLLSSTRLLLRYVANLIRTGLVRLRLPQMSIGGVMHITLFNVTSTPFTTSSSASSVSPERRTEFRREYCSSSSCWSSMASTFFYRVSIRAAMLASSQHNAFPSCCNPASCWDTPIAALSFMTMSLLPRACRNSCTNTSAFSVVTPIGSSSLLSLARGEAGVVPFLFARPGAIIAQRKSRGCSRQRLQHSLISAMSAWMVVLRYSNVRDWWAR